MMSIILIIIFLTLENLNDVMNINLNRLNMKLKELTDNYRFTVLNILIGLVILPIMIGLPISQYNIGRVSGNINYTLVIFCSILSIISFISFIIVIIKSISMDKNRLELNNRINRLKILELNVYIFHNKFTKETMIVAAMNPELACNAATSIIPDILDNSKVSGTSMKYNSGYPSDKNKDGIVLFNNYNIKL